MPRLYLMTGQIVGEIKGGKTVVAHASSESNGIIRLFVISGKPSRIVNLDDGIFRSLKYGDMSDKYVYVTTMEEFKRYKK